MSDIQTSAGVGTIGIVCFVCLGVGLMIYLLYSSFEVIDQLGELEGENEVIKDITSHYWTLLFMVIGLLIVVIFSIMANVWLNNSRSMYIQMLESSYTRASELRSKR